MSLIWPYEREDGGSLITTSPFLGGSHFKAMGGTVEFSYEISREDVRSHKCKKPCLELITLVFPSSY